MVQDAFKKQMLSSHELFQAKRWEGKPWRFKLKYAIANYPEFAISSFGFLVIIPALIAIKYFAMDHDKYKSLEKYKLTYTVVRDDAPNIKEIIEEKEFGRQYYPQ